MKTPCIAVLNVTVLCAAGLLTLVPSQSAQAALVAEMTFETVNTVPDPDTTPITKNKAGSSNLGQLVNGSAANVSINTGATGLSSAFIDRVRQGYIDIPSAASGGVVSVNTSGSNGVLSNYADFSGGGMGQGSILTVFKPNFNNQPPQRKTIFSHRVQTASQIWLLSNSTSGLYFRTGPDAALYNLALPSVSWDSSKWYAVGASWADTPLGGSNYDRQMNLYIRELSEDRPAALFDNLSLNNISVTGIATSNFFVGHRSNSLTEGADGDIGLFYMYDTFFSLNDFETAYAGLFVVPEPNTGMMLLMALPVAMLRRRKRQRS